MITATGEALPLVAVDGRSVNRLHVRGIGRYLLNLLRLTNEQLRWLVLGDSPDLPLHVPLHAGITSSVFETRGDRFHAWEQVSAPLRAARVGADVLFYPATVASVWQPVPTVITLHDVIPWIMEDEGFVPGLYRDRILPGAFRRASAIVTVSRQSAADIVRLWPDLKEKIHVIPHGIDDAYLTVTPGVLPATLRAEGVTSPYFVYVGGEIPRKRLEWALQAWMGLNDPSVKLVVCGVNLLAHQAIRDQVPLELRNGLYFASFIPEGEMPSLYANAVAVLYPTSYEGFGFPAIEAQACGTPILFSASGSLRELVGPGAYVMDPEDAASWQNTCRTLLAQRRAVIRHDVAARRWAAQFSWQRSAQRHVQLLRAIAARRDPRALY